MRLLTTATSDFDADVICARLRDAGIEPLAEGSWAQRGVPGGRAHDIYVDDHVLDRAREVLKEGENVDEDELARLSEESYREATGEGPPERGSS